MKKKLPNITNNLWSYSAIAAILVLWQTVSGLGIVESFMLPSPIQVTKAFYTEFPALMEHSVITLSEAFIGLGFGILLGFVSAVLMDHFEILYQAFLLLLKKRSHLQDEY